MIILLKRRNPLALEDFTSKKVRCLLGLTIWPRKESRKHVRHQNYVGEDFLLLFRMNSTYTRRAFETSANGLEMGTMFLSNSHFGNTGTIKGSMKVFSEVYNAIGYEGTKHSTLLGMAEDGAILITNGYTNHWHPTQMLVGAMTLDGVWGRESYKGKTSYFIGRGSAVNSFSYDVMRATLGTSFTYITPYMEMDETLEGLAAAEKATFRKFVPGSMVNLNWDMKMNARKRKIVEDSFAKYSPQRKFIETDDIDTIKGVDVITTESWGFFVDPVKIWLPGIVRFRPYQMNGELLEHTKSPDHIVIHVLSSTHNIDHASGQKLLSMIKNPDLRELLKDEMEVTDEVFEQDATCIFQEAGDRKYTIKAAIKTVLDGRQRENRLWTY